MDSSQNIAPSLTPNPSQKRPVGRPPGSKNKEGSSGPRFVAKSHPILRGIKRRWNIESLNGMFQSTDEQALRPTNWSTLTVEVICEISKLVSRAKAVEMIQDYISKRVKKTGRKRMSLMYVDVTHVLEHLQALQKAGRLPAAPQDQPNPEDDDSSMSGLNEHEMQLDDELIADEEDEEEFENESDLFYLPDEELPQNLRPGLGADGPEHDRFPAASASADSDAASFTAHTNMAFSQDEPDSTARAMSAPTQAGTPISSAPSFRSDQGFASAATPTARSGSAQLPALHPAHDELTAKVTRLHHEVKQSLAAVTNALEAYEASENKLSQCEKDYETHQATLAQETEIEKLLTPLDKYLDNLPIGSVSQYMKSLNKMQKTCKARQRKATSALQAVEQEFGALHQDREYKNQALLVAKDNKDRVTAEVNGLPIKYRVMLRESLEVRSS